MGVFYKGGSGGGRLTIPDELIFSNTINRDDYFTTNPSKLKPNLNVVVAGKLQQYSVDQVWVDVSDVIRGGKGSDAPEMIFQYSATGSSGWSNTLNTAIHKYWRWSTDGGVTWLPTPPSVASYSASSDSSGSGVPDPFEYQVSPQGKLQLLKGGELIAENDEYGGYITKSISTGTGSLHLGELHSVGGAGENVIFKNEDSTFAYYPSWGAISADGNQVIEQKVRVHGGSILTTQPVGLQGTNIIDYDTSITSVGDNVFLYMDIIPKENYTGKLTLNVKKASNNKFVSEFTFDANFTDGVLARVPFKYPLWTFSGQTTTTTLTKPDGSLLKVLSNTNGTAPWRQSSYRSFTDELMFHAGNLIEQAAGLNTLTGGDRISANAVRDFPIMSDSILGMAKLGATMSINGQGELNTSISPTSIKIVADEASRLTIPVSGGAILSIQQDNGFTYGIEAGDDTSVAGNWKQIGTVATDVVSFNGRNGAVVPETGDYNMEQIAIEDQTTPAKYVFRVESGVPYIEEIA